MYQELGSLVAGATIRNITCKHCSRWISRRGATLATQTFNHELDTMRAVLAFAVRHGLRLDTPAGKEHIRRTRVRRKEAVIPVSGQFQELAAAIRRSDGRPDSQRKAKPGADLVVKAFKDRPKRRNQWVQAFPC